MATLSFPRSRRGSPTPPAELIPTKLQPPRIRPQLVGRSRLYERLDQGRERQLTLVTAPAGSGKSTLLAQWLRHSRYPAGWLALEESDNQPARFIRYLVAALRRACPALDDPVEPLLQATTAGLDLPQLLASLIVLPLADDPQPRILVLDDYHLIHNDSLHQAMDWLLAHLPPALHLVIASRHDPPLALARLRVRDELIEIRAADLRFNHDETAAFLRQAMDLELDDADIATLESRTEGWAAALQLSALSLRDCPDRPALIAALGGNHRPIADYLVAEVLDRQSGERREFLLRCALLERFCGPLCMAVTGRADAQAELEALERDNLFLIPLDHCRRWYRFHHLFAELLCRRLEQQRPAEIPVLLRRAALWHWQAGQVHEAITYARRAGDRELLVELLEAEGENLLMRGDTDAVRGWLEGLPDRLYRQRPRLAVLEGWCTGIAGQFERTARIIALGREGLAGSNDLAPAEKLKLGGHFTAINAFLASNTGESERGLRLAEQALAELPPEEDLVRSVMALSVGNNYLLAGHPAPAEQALSLATESGQRAGNLYVAAVALWCRGQLACLQGRLDAAERYIARDHQLLREARCERLPLIGYVELGRGRVAHERFRLDEAEQALRQSLERADLLQDLGFQVLARVWLGAILLTHDDLAGARREILAARHRMDAGSWHDPWHELQALEARLALVEGDPARSERLLEGGMPGLEGNTAAQHALNRERARLALAQDRGPEILAPLTSLAAATENGGLLTQALELRVLEVIALAGAGREADARATLGRIVPLARSRGLRRPFAEQAAALAPLAGTLDPADRQFLAPGPVTAPGAALVEPISAREQQVLELVARGLSNRDIAERLHVSVGTVKTHLHNLLGKFQVGNRTEAVHRARRLGLLAEP